MPAPGFGAFIYDLMGLQRNADGSAWDAEDLAQAVGVSSKTVRLWIQGRSTEVGTTNLDALARALRTPIEVLFSALRDRTYPHPGTGESDSIRWFVVAELRARAEDLERGRGWIAFTPAGDASAAARAVAQVEAARRGQATEADSPPPGPDQRAGGDR